MIAGDGIQFDIQRDLDCDCPWWLRWRIVQHRYTTNGRMDSWESAVVAHTRTKLGALWKRRQLRQRTPGPRDVVI